MTAMKMLILVMTKLKIKMSSMDMKVTVKTDRNKIIDDHADAITDHEHMMWMTQVTMIRTVRLISRMTAATIV